MKTNLKSLFLILAVAVPFLFTSCDSDDNAAEITIAFNQSGVFKSGDAIVGTITSIEENLTKVVILLDGKAVKTYTSFNNLPIKKGENGAYAVFISDITEEGTYTLRAESKTGENSKTFTVASAIEYTVTKIVVETGKTYGYKQGSTIGTFHVNAASTGSVEVTIGDQKVVLLSDSGNSYMLSSFTGANFATAKDNVSNILFCLLANSTTIASATEATSADIKTNAIETKFTASAIN